MSVVGDAFAALKNIVLIQERIDVMQRDITRISTDVASVTDYARAIDIRVSTIEGYLRGRSESAAQAGPPRIEG